MEDSIRDSLLKARLQVFLGKYVTGYCQWDVLPGAGGPNVSSRARRVSSGDIAYVGYLHQHHPGDQMLLTYFDYCDIILLNMNCMIDSKKFNRN